MAIGKERAYEAKDKTLTTSTLLENKGEKKQRFSFHPNLPISHHDLVEPIFLANCVQYTSKLTAHSGKRRGVEAAIDPDQLDISSLAQSQILNHVSLSR